MEKSLPGQQDYFEAFIKAAQYLARLTSQQDLWSETGKVLVNFFGAEVGAVEERRANGEVARHRWAFSERYSGLTDLKAATREAIAEVLESGFLSARIIFTPDPLSIACFPITRENQVVAVMVVGHGMSEPLPRELLNVYLAVAGLVGTTGERLASERELRRHRRQLEAEIAERKRAEEALRESEKRYRIVADNTYDWEFWLSPEGQFLYNSPSCQRITGHTVDECVRDPGLLYRIIHPQDRERFMLHNQQVVDKKTPGEIEFRILLRDEGVRHIHHVCQPVFDNQGHYLGKRGSNRDITERKRAEEELRAHRDHLEELVRERTAELTIAKDAAEEARRLAEVASLAKSAFLANMSHELRTPLNAILGYAQILQRRPLEPDVIDALHTVQRSGEHLLTLINDILDIARIEVGKVKLSPAPIHFPNFLEHIASIIRTRAEAKGLAFVFERLNALPTVVQADETRLRQVLLNLLDNAVKFTDAGQVTLRVQQMGKWANGQMDKFADSQICRFADLQICRFEVQDTGIGIPPDQLERIFQPFEQVEDVARSSKGTGLGLAISRQLVRLMGSELHVHSEPGRGSAFWFEVALPLTEMDRAAAQPSQQGVIGYKGPRRAVLVVDDVPSNRAVLVDLLAPLGFDIIEAADGQQALHLARELCPDLILMDRWMPVLNGFEAVRQLRQIPGLARAPIIAISASVLEQDQAQSREAGVNAFLPKPINWADLAALLQEYLQLEWEYESARELSDETLAPPHPHPPAPLTPPPQEELLILLDLALRGNMWAIQERAAHIETLGEQYVPFARRLRELARDFEEEQIMSLIERYVEEDQ